MLLAKIGAGLTGFAQQVTMALVDISVKSQNLVVLNRMVDRTQYNKTQHNNSQEVQQNFHHQGLQCPHVDLDLTAHGTTYRGNSI